MAKFGVVQKYSLSVIQFLKEKYHQKHTVELIIFQVNQYFSPMKVQLSSEAIQAAVKLCKKSAPDKILRTHVVLQFYILCRVTLWIFWCLFVPIMSYYFFNLNFWKVSPHPPPHITQPSFIQGLITRVDKIVSKFTCNRTSVEWTTFSGSCPFLESGHLKKKVPLSQGSTKRLK